MNKIKIKVYDNQDAVHGGAPQHWDTSQQKIYEVEAYCVDGEEGIFALFDNPIGDGSVCLASGDDGMWNIDYNFAKHYIPEFIEMLKSYQKEK